MDMLQIGNHTLYIQHWTDQGGGVEDVAFVCFVVKDGKTYECNATKVFDVWEAGSVNAAEVEARKAATKHIKQLKFAVEMDRREKLTQQRVRNEEYFGKPSGKP